MNSNFRIFTFLHTLILTLTVCYQWSAAQVPDSLSKSDAEALRFILTEAERKEFDKIESPREKAHWAKIYWKQRDPTPTTERNERLQEYLRRIAHAKEFFTALTLTGFDDRGEVYIKYGEPYQKYSQPVGTSFARANESWSYSHIYPGLIFDFISDGTAYSLTDDFRKAVVSKSSIVSSLISIYQSRSDLDLKYASTAEALTHILNVTRDEHQMRSLAFEQLSEFASESHKSRIEAPVASYDYDYQKKPLHLALSLARFREPNGRFRLELYYGIPVNELAFSQMAQYWHTPIVSTVAIFDSLYNTVAADSVTIDLRVPDEASTKMGLLNNQFNFSLPPGAYHTTLRVENVPGNRLGIVQADIPRPAFSFSADSLAISDLQMSHQIVVLGDSDEMKTENKAGNEKYIKHGLRIAPLAGQMIDKNRMLFVYFEIYGLALNESGQTRNALQYTLRSTSSKKGLLKKIVGIFGGKKEKLSVTETRQGQSPGPVEHIGIDLSKQPDGEYALEITVRDLNAEREVVSHVPVVLK